MRSVGAGLFADRTLPYLRDIIRRKTCPHLFTWLIWSLIGVITVTAQAWDHAGIGVWVTIFSTMKCVAVALLSFKYGEKKITRGDWISLAACLFSIPLWLMTGDPLLSVLLLLAIEMVAFYPTYRKTWHKPFEETLFAYNIASLQFAFGLCALENYTIVTTLGGLSVVVQNSVFVLYALSRRRALK